MKKFRYILIVVILIVVVVTVLVLSIKWRGDEIYRKVIISGNHTITEKEILKYAGLEDLSKIKSDEINENEIVERLKIHPDIKKVFVYKNPPEEIKIEIIEKNPIAIVNVGNELNFIDEELELVPFKNTGKVYDLPIINGIKFNKDKVYENYTKTELKIAITILMTIYRESKLLSDMISEINMSDNNNIILYTHDYTIPIFIPKYSEELFKDSNLRNDLLKRIKVMKCFLEEIYPEEKKEEIDKINLTYSNQLIVSFKE
ncbi:MAG: FtsQ-type POTRA domain-containing protein [Ignavibacteria bacterium]|nr:FtsQ-type POTRA domain-containing protein [Ignavibacteria bacterium]